MSKQKWAAPSAASNFLSVETKVTKPDRERWREIEIKRVREIKKERESEIKREIYIYIYKERER